MNNFILFYPLIFLLLLYLFYSTLKAHNEKDIDKVVNILTYTFVGFIILIIVLSLTPSIRILTHELSKSTQNSQNTITQDAEYSIEKFGFTIESNTIIINEIKDETKLLEVYSLKKLEVPTVWNNLKVDIDEDFYNELVKDGIRVYFK